MKKKIYAKRLDYSLSISMCVIVDSGCTLVNYHALTFTKFSAILISREVIVFIRGETLSAQSARSWKIPGWIVLVREYISVDKWASKNLKKSKLC